MLLPRARPPPKALLPRKALLPMAQPLATSRLLGRSPPLAQNLPPARRPETRQPQPARLRLATRKNKFSSSREDRNNGRQSASVVVFQPVPTGDEFSCFLPGSLTSRRQIGVGDGFHSPHQLYV